MLEPRGKVWSQFTWTISALIPTFSAVSSGSYISFVAVRKVKAAVTSCYSLTVQFSQYLHASGQTCGSIRVEPQVLCLSKLIPLSLINLKIKTVCPPRLHIAGRNLGGKASWDSVNTCSSIYSRQIFNDNIICWREESPDQKVVTTRCSNIRRSVKNCL